MSEWVLVSPVGLRHGALYSALIAAGPVTRLVVICSQATENSIGAICAAAGYSREVVPLVLDDAFPTPEEIYRRAEDALPLLDGAREVLVNITGGTTLMGVLAERIATRARRRGLTVRRFAVVDRRTHVEQETDPFVAGESYWLDDEPEGSA